MYYLVIFKKRGCFFYRICAGSWPEIYAGEEEVEKMINYNKGELASYAKKWGEKKGVSIIEAW